MAQRGRKLAPERVELLERLVEDGWPIRQITATHGFNFSTIKRLHPDYTGMSDPVECGRLSAEVQRVDDHLRKTYGRKAGMKLQ